MGGPSTVTVERKDPVQGATTLSVLHSPKRLSPGPDLTAPAPRQVLGEGSAPVQRDHHTPSLPRGPFHGSPQTRDREHWMSLSQI